MATATQSALAAVWAVDTQKSGLDSAPSHSGTTTTETMYRKQIRPVIIEGAEVMDQLFPGAGEASPDA